MFFRSSFRYSRSFSSSALLPPYTRQIEVLHDFHSQNSQGPSCESDEHIIFDTPNAERNSIADFVIAELVNTEQTYVRELQSIVDYYIKPFEAPENANQIPAPIRDRADIVFGNLRDLLHFHDTSLLAEFLRYTDSVVDICHCFMNYRNQFLQLYHPYCQNKPLSEALRREHVDGCKFFSDCQKRAGHPLPLSAYLLKPIQRITKYQLLLKELHRHCSEEVRNDVELALSTMLDLLAQLNAAMHQLHISGFAGDLSLLGPLRLQSECDVFAFKKKAKRLNKAQRRHLFLFDGGVLFCKKRTQPVPYAPEYYEHKLCIPTCSLGFVDTSKTSPSRFEIWDETKSEAYAIQPLDENAKIRWIQRLNRLTSEAIPERCSHNRSQRPQSWTSTISNDSTASTRSSSGETTTSIESALMDPNGNQAVLCSNSPISSIPISASSEGCSETRQMADNDNNITTTDLDCDSSNSRSTLTSTSTPNEDRHIPPDSSTTASLNTIVESSSQNELLAAI